jgi:hypothetical protein
MSEFLHQVVAQRERNTTRPTTTEPSIFNEVMRNIEEEYRIRYVQGGMHERRVVESIDRYMSSNTPIIGMTIQMPVISNTPDSYGRLGAEVLSYRFTGILPEGYRGWVRVQ